MKKLIIAAVMLFGNQVAHATFEEGYECGLNMAEDGMYHLCFGNWGEPSKEYEKGVEQAKRDFEYRNKSATCNIKYAAWIPNGSRAHGFTELPAVIEKADELIGHINQNNVIFFVDENGNLLGKDFVNKLTQVNNGKRYMSELGRVCLQKINSIDYDNLQ